jgi:Cytochrome P460
MKIIGFAGIGMAGLSAMALIVAHGQMNTSTPGNQPRAESVVDAAGNMHVPETYRTTYEFLGSWAIAAKSDKGSQELHVVYASPGTAAAYRKTGRFADGTVLIKEVFAAATGPLTTGTVSWAKTLKGWFVMVKDSQGRHPGNQLWGDGWGWSWFDAGNPSKTTTTDYNLACRTCHVPVQGTDWVYIEGYPPLGCTSMACTSMGGPR